MKGRGTGMLRGTPQWLAEQQSRIRLPRAGGVEHKPKPELERDVLPAVLLAIQLNRRTAFAFRANTGAATLGAPGQERIVRFNFKGCADILFMLKGGRFGACEVKTASGQLTPEQTSFLANVNANGGLGFVARGIDDVIRELEAA